jgi:uncharacterized protein YkwD
MSALVKLTFAAAAVSLGLVALACSSDDDDEPQRSETPAPGAPAPTSPPNGTPTSPPSSSSPLPGPGPSPMMPSTGSKPPEGPAGALLALVNAARAEARSCGGEGFAAAPPLTWDARLGAAAQAHSDDMVARGYFDHESPDGGTPSDRIGAQGYAFSAWGENIAAGQATPADAMKTWLESPGHCSNIMSPALKDFGAGLAEGGEYRFYWTQVFAAPGR